jgi:hypothetical protein
MTTDRTMTPRLAAALDGLTGAEKRHLKTIAAESKTPWLHGLLDGLAAEVVVAEAREATNLHAHYLDHLADVDKAAEGADWSHVPPPEPRTVDCWPEAAPVDLSGLDDGGVAS